MLSAQVSSLCTQSSGLKQAHPAFIVSQRSASQAFPRRRPSHLSATPRTDQNRNSDLDSLGTVVLLHKILGTLNSSNPKPFSRAAFLSICRALMPSSCFSIGEGIRWRLRIQGIQLGRKAFSRTDQ